VTKGLPDLSAQAVPGAVLRVRAHPRARRNALTPGEPIRIEVTAAPEAGRANAAIRDLLAKALGVAPSRLTLTHGASGRDKRFQLDASDGPTGRTR
jgi:uncharacterized protein